MRLTWNNHFFALRALGLPSTRAPAEQRGDFFMEQGSKIGYPFAAVPNQIVRGGVGVVNLAVFASILSHGECFASIATIAKEIDCGPKRVRSAIKWWRENAEKFGISFNYEERRGFTPVIHIVIHRIENPSQNGQGGTPKTARGTPPKTDRGRRTHEEDILRRCPPNPPRGIKNNHPESVKELISKRYANAKLLEMSRE